MTAQQLKNSILQMAVQGKLVPQNPDDEPASVLLRRIKAEKEELIKAGKIKKDKKSSEIFRGATHNLPYAYCEQIGKEIRDISDEIPFDIPDSWEWVRLGIISTYNQTKQKINAKDADASIWGLDLEDIEKGGKLLEKKTVGERKAVGDKTLFNKGDILYSKLRPYLLKILVAPDSGICTPEIVPFTIYGGISAEYIVHFLKSPYVDGLVNGETYGIKMPRAGTETMISLLVPLPPIDEQNRIVSKIEELLPHIEKYGKAEEHLTALNTTFPEALKKSILQEAVQGKLVPQNPDDEPVSVLLERIRAEKQELIKVGKIKKDKHKSVIVTRDKIPYEIIDGKERCIADEVPFELPESWCWCRISNLFSVGTGMTPLKSEDKYYKNATVPWVNSSQTSQRYIKDVDTHITEYALENTSLVLYEPHTLIVAMYGQGKTRGQVSELLIPATVNQACAALTAITYSQDMIEYVYYFFVYNYEIMRKKAEGTSQPNLNIQKIKDIILPLPPLAEQKRIVAKIEELMQYCEKL
ncbi:restriction endonuclease subunit S [Ruminococcus sp.]|uniref:restriction endonuclease subunit S n=1 Tax=Ruminococcus sp. TaxID=41978 RepID=UPI002584418F|nr:restriction endonuclease subunit S [Ruminococcus sp.]MCR5019417.1 restriction endonuclease subunit S [Ruminococcus sp.]